MKFEFCAKIVDSIRYGVMHFFNDAAYAMRASYRIQNWTNIVHQNQQYF